MLTDHHCHLQDSKIYLHLVQVLENAATYDISRFICCGTCEDDWQSVLDLSAKYSQIIPAIGIHPWEVDKVSENWQNRMESILREKPNCLVGEIGLDLHFCKDTIEKQLDIVRLQLEIADKYHRPVSIHNLKTWHLLLPILKQFYEVKIMLHAFFASQEIVTELIQLPNVYFSISSSLLEKSDVKLLEFLGNLPIDKILFETDSPFMLPKYKKITNKEFNEPANLIFVLEKMAEILKIDIENLKAQIKENSKRFLTI